jgi:hypothetical protein
MKIFEKIKKNELSCEVVILVEIGEKKFNYSIEYKIFYNIMMINILKKSKFI